MDLERWGKIDKAEQERGRRKGRVEREKFSTVEEMLEVGS